MRTFIVLVTATLATVLIASAQQGKPAAQKAESIANSSLMASICFEYDTGIPDKLTFDVKSDRKKIWLGVSLYPKDYKDALREGEHYQIELNTDRSARSVALGKKFQGGYFEAAIWGKKVTRADCTIPKCYWCGKNGFHLDEMLYYKTGPLWFGQ